MWTYAKLGWTSARRCWFLLLLLFLYQYTWGFLLFKYVKSTVVPILHRYPGEQLPAGASQLFWMEGQFQMMKTDLLTPYIWTFAAFVAVRMLITPLINGGLYHALHYRNGGQRRSFFTGARKYAKPFLLLYMLQMAVTFVPLLWLIPHGINAVTTAADWREMAVGLLPWIVGWLVYQGILELAFMYVGFGIVAERSGWASLGTFVRYAFNVFGLALLVFAVTMGIAVAVAAVSLWWAGFLAVMIHQAYPLVRAILRLWGISAQHQLWSSKRIT